MKLKLLLFCYLFALETTQAQYQISGTILSEQQAPIEFASVSIYPLRDSSAVRGVITGRNGSFILKDLKDDTYQLTVQMLGYADWTQRVELLTSVVLPSVILTEETTELSTVQVIAEQSAIETHLGKKVLRIGKDLTATGSNALEALEKIPSVTTTPRGQVQIRGNSNVVIYINGKETRRDPATLQFIAAESLEKIEIITNPSAAYDAEGVGGIINIVYKKDQTGSFKLELISSLSVLTDPFNLSPNGGINLSWTKRKFSFFTNISYDYGEATNVSTSTRTNFRDSLQRYESRNLEVGIGRVSNALLGFSIEPDSTTSVGLEINFDRWDTADNIEQRSTFDYRTAADQIVTLPTYRAEVEDELWVNASLEKEFRKDQQLKLSLTAGGEDETNFTNSEPIDLLDLPTNVQQFLASSNEKESQRYYQGKADYELPFFKSGTLQLGMKADFIRYNILQKINLRGGGATDALPDNDFKMDMQKLGLYAIQKYQIKKLEYALGLRLEQFNSEAFQQADGSTFAQKYLRLFPSLQLNYLLADREQTLGLNYTRRIKRPGFFDLNPYVSYEDPLNLETGNPALEPEIADLLEVNYHQEWQAINVDVTLYNRTTSNSIQAVVRPFNNNRTLATYVNIGKEMQRGMEAQLEYRVTKALKASGTLVVAQNSYEDTENEISYNQQTTWSVRARQELKLPANWKMTLTQTYRAPSYQIQEKRHEVFYLNIGIGKKFTNKRGSFSLSVRDIFNTRQYIVSLLTSDFELTRSYKWQTRQVAFGFKYLIFDKKY